jgi:hypothetical protein
MIGHDDAVSSVKGLMLGLEEVIRVVQVDVLVPSLLGSLVPSKIWVGGDENSCLDVFMAKS